MISVVGKMTVTGGDKDNLHLIVAADGQIHFELNATPNQNDQYQMLVMIYRNHCSHRQNE